MKKDAKILPSRWFRSLLKINSSSGSWQKPTSRNYCSDGAAAASFLHFCTTGGRFIDGTRSVPEKGVRRGIDINNGMTKQRAAKWGRDRTTRDGRGDNLDPINSSSSLIETNCPDERARARAIEEETAIRSNKRLLLPAPPSNNHNAAGLWQKSLYSP